MRIQSKLLAAVAAMGVLSGCDGGGGGESAAEFINSLPPASVTSSSNVIAFASISSAPAVFAAGAAPVALGQFAGQNGGCPTVTQNGNSVTVTGGCTDGSGQTWSGTARSTETGISYNDFSIASTDTCNGTTFNTLTTFNGTMTPTSTGGFEADLRYDLSGFDEDSCQAVDGTIAWSYSGTSVAGTGESATWSGTGIIGMSGVGVDENGDITTAVDGMVEAETTDEVIDENACQDEALSGTTTIRGGTDTVVITYDGATDCDTESTVRWSLNGTDQGEIAGVACTVSGTSSGAPGTGFAFAALAGLAALLVRRR